MRAGHLVLLLVLLVVLVCGSGCITVQPWEKEYLADPIMGFDDWPDQAFQQEISEIREASALGKEGSGGGCGCN